MRRLLALIVLAVPLQHVAAQAVTLDNGTLVVPAGVVDLGTGTLNVAANGTLAETGGRVTTSAPGTLTTSPPRSFEEPTGGTPVNVAGLGFAIETTFAPGDVTVTRGHEVQTGAGNSSIGRYYDVTATMGSGLDATVVFHYHDAELNGLPEEELVLFRSEDGGATWIGAGGTVDTAANTITVSGVDSFSRWTAGASSAPLPVELVAFDGRADGFDVVLQWSTASEARNAGFDVQRMDTEAPGHGGAQTWETLAFVEGRGTTAEAQTYTYRAAALEPGTHRFRLRQVDFDGAFAYSPEVEVTVGVPGGYLLSPAYPNPFNPQTTVALALQAAQHVRLAVYDALGRQVAVLHEGELAGGKTHRFTFDGAALPSGVYLLRVDANQFQETRKLVLLK